LSAHDAFIVRRHLAATPYPSDRCQPPDLAGCTRIANSPGSPAVSGGLGLGQTVTHMLHAALVQTQADGEIS